jgi:hypothetical protein
MAATEVPGGAVYFHSPLTELAEVVVGRVMVSP